MEIRVLRYFMEIAREENMTKAAEKLHISQPSLSKEIKKLEEELGHPLFIRTNKNMRLNDEGMLLRKRASDILAMVDKTAEEFSTLDSITGGEIRIGCAESVQIKYLARAIKAFKEKYPNFMFHIFSGDTEPVAERLDRGLLDIAVIVEPPNLSKYNYLPVPGSDKWALSCGVIVCLQKNQNLLLMIYTDCRCLHRNSPSRRIFQDGAEKTLKS